MLHRSLVLPSAAVMLALAFAGASAADDVPAPRAAPSASGVFEPATSSLVAVLAKAKAESKPALLAFSTEKCSVCCKLEKNTLGQASVAEAMKSFVNFRVDVAKEDGRQLAKRYCVSTFPTLLVVDAGGDEIDRIAGYRSPARFTTEIGRILKGEGTLVSLRKSYAATPDDVDAGIALAAKLATSKPDESGTLFAGLAEKTKDRASQGKIHLEHAATLLATKQVDAAMKQAETLVREFGDTPAAAHAASRVGWAFLRTDADRALAFLSAARGVAKDPKELVAIEGLTVAAHRNGLAQALTRQAQAAGDDAQTLNAVAWTCFEEKVNLREAVGWARKAVDKSNRNAAILDTLANLLWLTGAREEAIKTETEAAGKVDGSMKKAFDGIVAKWSGAPAASNDEDGEEDEGDEDGEGDEN